MSTKPLSGKESAVLNYMRSIDRQMAAINQNQVVSALTDNELEDLYKLLKRHTQELESWVSTFKLYKNELTKGARASAGLPESTASLDNLLEGLKKALKDL